MSRNRVELSGRLLLTGPLRHTPAAVPVFEMRLEHESNQLEAGLPRSVKASIASVAIGPLAERLSRLRSGDPVILKGFLAARRANSRSMVLHVTEFELAQEN